MNPLLTKSWDAVLQGEWRGIPPESVAGWSYDTRLLKPGECFLALRTDRRDGHQFLANAKAGGALAAWVEEWDLTIDLPQYKVENPLKALQKLAHYHRKNFKGKVLGVTGSCGKTSTKDLLKNLLGLDKTFATEGNFNNFLGLPLMLLKLNSEGHQFGVFETGISVPGEMKVLADILSPDIGIVTAIAPVHLEAMKNLETIAYEKSRLLAGLDADDTAFLGATSLQYKVFQDLNCPTVAVCREGEEALVGHYQYLIYTASENHSLKFTFQGKAFEFQVRPLSRGMQGNVVLALAVSLHLGVSPELLQERLNAWAPSSLRGEWVELPGKKIYLDCYNASPVSMVDALQLFYDQAPKDLPRLYIIGGMNELGEAAPDYHEAVGQELFLRPMDEAYILGEHRFSFINGAKQNVIDYQKLKPLEDIEGLKMILQNFEGSVFIKGSHSFRLWELV